MKQFLAILATMMMVAGCASGGPYQDDMSTAHFSDPRNPDYELYVN